MYLIKPRLVGLSVVLIAGILGLGALQQSAVGVQEQALVWRIVGDQSAPDARHENAYVEVNGLFYLMGGRGTKRVQRYNPNDSTWTNLAFQPIDIHHFQPVVIDDTVYVVSAYTGTFPDEPTVNEVYKYVPLTDQWLVGSSIPVSRRRGSGGTAIYNGKIYVVGGSTGGHGGSSVRKNQFDEYNPVTDTWTTLPNAPHARDHVHAVVVGNKLYVTGGRDGGNGDNVAEVDVYDFNAGSWSTLPSPSGDLPIPRAGAASVAVGNYVVVIGGESTRDDAHVEVHALHTLTNNWVTMNALNVGRHGTQAIYHNNNIYIAAGSAQKGGSPELDSQEVLETNGQTNLPVELSNFQAHVDEGQAILTWTTVSETNNAGFEVQQSVNGTFESLGFVEGMGTTLATQSYQFETGALAPGQHIFRLKQIDFDGRFEYSPQVTTTIPLEDAYHLGAVYPNPLNPEARFTLSLARTQTVRVEAFDMLGRSVSVIFEGSLNADQVHSLVINSQGWAGGRYQLVATGEHFSASRGFTVLK